MKQTKVHIKEHEAIAVFHRFTLDPLTHSYHSAILTHRSPISSTMSPSSRTPVSPSQFELILAAALSEYKEITGNVLLDDWLAKELQSCESVEAVLDIIQDQAEAFDKFRNGGKKLMKWIGSSVHVLYTISATLGDGVGVVVPSAKAVFSGIGVLLAAVKDVRASHDALADLFERIEFFLKRLGVHTRISATRDMVEILVKIMAEVIVILSVATKEMQRSCTKIYLRKLLGRTDIEDALKRLDILTQEEVRMAIAQVLKGIDKLKDDAKKVNGAMQHIANKVDKIQWNQIEQDVRRWFSPPDPSVNYNTAREAYQEGTAAWFFEGSIFKEWELVGSLLWIHGKPGSGKSILCSAVIKHVMSLRDAGCASLLYFFFDFQNKEKQNVRNFLTSLLTQLSAYSEACCGLIFRLYSTYGRGAQQPSIGVLTDCIKEMLKVVAQQSVYIIVDALDECPDDVPEKPTPREGVLNFVEGLVHMQLPSLHVCITSRMEIDIKESLEPLAYCAVSLHDESGQQKDISDYVRNDVYSDRMMRKWRDGEKKLVVEELSNKADGMFRWVFCQLRVLRYCHPSSIRRTLDQLPKSLDETYARVLSQIPEVNQEHAHRLLQCLMVAVRPLRVEELAEVLAFEFDTAKGPGRVPRYRADWRPNDRVEAVQSTCSSLIVIVDDHGSQVVQFSHFSVKEFLMSARLTSSLGDFSRYQILPGPAHTILAQACLGFLLRSDDHVDEESDKNFPLAEYAAKHWVAHAQFEDVASRVRDGMVSLFDCDKPHFTAWVGIYNIDEGFYGASPSNIPPPLYYSSLCGFCDLVEHLATKHRRHVNTIGGWYKSPLRAALARKHIAVAEILLKNGADVDIRGNRERTPLHEAIRDISVVRLLLKYGADVNCQQHDHGSPLHLVARYGKLEVAQVLLKHEANVDSRDNEGKTPLYLLSEDRYRNNDDILSLVRLLLEYGADVNIQTMNDGTPLHAAAFRGWAELARVFLDRGANVNAENEQGETPLHLVSRGEYDSQEHGVDIARLLLERNVDTNAKKIKWSPLHLAALKRRPEVAQVLLIHDAGMNEQGASEIPLLPLLDTNAQKEWAPSHSAAFKRRLEVLLDYRAVEAENDRGEVPLHSREHDVGIARLLPERSVDVNTLKKNKTALLHLAAFRGRLEIVRVLLDHGANANAENERGETPLHLVTRGDFDSQEYGVSIARLLLDRGVDIHAQDTDGSTALHSAAFMGRLEIAQVLLHHGASADAENEQGETPLHLVSRGEYDLQGHGVGIAQLLLEQGVDVNARKKNQWTPLHLGAFKGNSEISRVLLDNGASTNAGNDQGETPLHLASRGKYGSHGHGVSVARLLLERGADVDAQDKNQDTPLHSASYLGRLEIARVLLDHGAKAGSENDRARTPLHLVSQGSYWFKDDGLDVAKLLLERGANMNAEDKDYATPLHLARYRGRRDIARFLLDYDAKAPIREEKD